MSLSDRQIWILSVTERVTASISLVGVLFILFTYAFSPAFNKPINRQIFYATWSNLGICIAALIGVNGYTNGVDMPLCKFQAFLVQMFLAVDGYWALCMAINVYLAFFSGYTVEQLRALDIKYLLISYGASTIPALVFLVVETPRGQIYGDASVWCWISADWDYLRLVCVYAFVWIALLLSLIVYIKAGRVIYKRRHELDGFMNPWNETPFASVITTEVTITHEDRTTSDSHIEEGAPAGLDSQEQSDRIYSVNVEAAAQKRAAGGLHDVMNMRTVTREIAIADSNAESWLYARVAFLFFVALAITWIPSSVNRVYGIFNPFNPSFGLSMLTAVLLPLQGLWNVIVYIITSRTACERLWAKCLGRPQAPLASDNRQKRAGSGEQSLISDHGHRGRSGSSLGSIKSRMSRERRGRGRGGREIMDEVMMGKIGRERLGSTDGERTPAPR